MASRWACRARPEPVVEDGGQQLVLGIEIPVEDALAHTDRIHDGGDRRSVVTLVREGMGRGVDELARRRRAPFVSANIPAEETLWAPVAIGQ